MNATRYLGPGVARSARSSGSRSAGAMWIAGRARCREASHWAVTTVIGGIPLRRGRGPFDRQAGAERRLHRAPRDHRFALARRVPGGRGDRADAVDAARRSSPTRTGVLTASSPPCWSELRSWSTATRTASCTTRPIDEVGLGDRLFVKTGEVVPVDGVLEGDAVLDESALTGESRPVERPARRSGPLGRAERRSRLRPARDVDRRRTARTPGIVRLVEEAERQKAPARPAGRPVRAHLRAGHARDRRRRVARSAAIRSALLSVLVVATPCPLILAVPIAVVAGISRAAKRGSSSRAAGRWRRSPAARPCCSTRPAR